MPSLTKVVNDIRRDNLMRLIDALGGPTSLALKLGYANGTYLSQLAGRNPSRTVGEKVARMVETKLSLPDGWMDTPNMPVVFDRTTRAAPRAQTAQRQEHAARKSAQVDTSFQSRMMPLPEPGPRDLPVYGTVQGGFNGAEVNYHDPVEYIQRPPTLIGVAKACGVYVTGESMEPRYYAGEIVLVDPRRPARTGDFVVVELSDDRAIVKRLTKRNDKGITVSQLNPPEEKNISRAEVVGVYRIVGTVTE